MSKQKAEKPPHAAGCWPREWAIFCWLRINPDVAKSYGIAKCNGQTTMGSMLEQMLRAQGADIDWLDELPESAAALQKGTNAWSAAFISRFAKRPGRRLKSLRQRLQELLAKDHVTPGVTAAVGRKDGKTPRLNFPKIAELAAKRRAKVSTRCYNKVEACAEVAFVERRRLVTFVETKLRCRCGAALRFDKKRSHQVGVCASYQFQCEKSCKIPPLLCVSKARTSLTSPYSWSILSEIAHGCAPGYTSSPLSKPCPLFTLHVHLIVRARLDLALCSSSAPARDDDYMLNAKLNYAIITCALSFHRMVPFLLLMGLLAPSTTDHYATKAEITPIIGDAAERSMAMAHLRNVGAKALGFMSIDAGFTAPRNAHGATMAAHAPDGSIIEIVHRRLTDAGATTSKGLETMCYVALLAKLRVQLYGTAVMDGCRELL